MYSPWRSTCLEALKIFRIEPTNPLIWQLSYNDSEVDKIVANRYTDMFAKPKRSKSYQPCKSKKIKRKKLHTDSLWYHRL